MCSVLATVFSLLTTSCNKQQKEEAKTDSTAVAQQTETKAEEPVAEVEEEKPEFASLDLQTFNLRGQVKEVKEYRDKEKEPFRLLGFDKLGRITTMLAYKFQGPVPVQYIYKNETSFEGDFKTDEEDYVNTNLERDKQNRLTNIPNMGFEYDADGKLKGYDISGWEDGTSFTQLTFDDKGNVLTNKYSGAGEGCEWVGTQKIEYTAFDEKGNWTNCKISDTGCFCDMDENPDDMPKETNKSTRRRVITYYE